MSRAISVLEWRRLTSSCEVALSRFLTALSDADRATFHPHAFTAEAVREVCDYSGDDVYACLFEGDDILAYGMLRGWDAGYQIPSLGIAVHPSTRGTGIGRLVMGILHATARRRGASRVRLTVHPNNRSAVSLYRSLGYQFSDDGPDKLVGYLAFHPTCE